MNGTDDGEYVFFTGKQNYTDFTRVAKWRNERYSQSEHDLCVCVLDVGQPFYLESVSSAYSNLEWWSTDQCNMINGTNAASFHSIISKDEMLYMFSSDLCRFECQFKARQSLSS